MMAPDHPKGDRIRQGIFLLAIVLHSFAAAAISNKGDIYQKVLGTFSYAGDMYMAGMVNLTRTSLFWWAVDVLKPNLDNDFAAFPLYCAIYVMAALYLRRILVEFFGVADGVMAFVAMLALAKLDYFLTLPIHSGWTTQGLSSQTTLAYALAFPLCYYALARRWWTCALVGALSMLTAIKVAWFPVGAVAVLGLVAGGQVSRRLAVPLAFVGSLVLIGVSSGGTAGMATDFASRLLYCEIALGDLENNIVHELEGKLPLLAATLVVYAALGLRARTAAARQMVLWVGVLTVVMAAAAWWYSWQGYRIYPEPRLLVLAIPHALTLFGTLLGVMIVAAVAVAPWRLSLRLALLVAFYCVNLFPTNLAYGSSLAAGVLGLELVLHLARGRLALSPAAWQRGAVALLLLLPLRFDLGILRNAEPVMLRHMHKWTAVGGRAPGQSEANLAAIRLRACDDFIILPMWGEPREFDPTVAYLSGKSRFIYNPSLVMFYGRHLVDEHFLRQALVERLAGAASVAAADAEALRERNVAMFLAASQRPLVEGIAEILPIDDRFILASFVADPAKAEMLRRCLPPRS